MYYLYKITNTVNDKVYIGATSNMKRRWSGHKTKNSKCPKLRNAMKKHGKDAFTMTALCIGDKEYILDLEKKAIIAYDSIANGYNVHEGGLFVATGQKMLNTDKHTPVFVRGFWFPDRATCLDKLNKSDSWYINNVKSPTFGDQSKWSVSNKPVRAKRVYVAGFWFLSVAHASDVLGVSESKIFRDSKNPALQSDNPPKPYKPRAVIIHGDRFESIVQAVENTEFSYRTIARKLKNNSEGFKYD